MPSISRPRHYVGARNRLDAQHIHIHNHIGAAKKCPKVQPKPKMVHASTQTSAADILDQTDPRDGIWPKVRQFRHRTVSGLNLACHVAWSVISFYARRVTIGINLADAFFGRGR